MGCATSLFRLCSRYCPLTLANEGQDAKGHIDGDEKRNEKERYIADEKEELLLNCDGRNVGRDGLCACYGGVEDDGDAWQGGRGGGRAIYEE
jgi:hypothetical protein